MTAVKNKNLEVVKILLLNTRLEHLDNNSNSIFHYAANSNANMVNLLASKSTVNLNHCNLDGYTPLHLACLSDNPDCVNALVRKLNLLICSNFELFQIFQLLAGADVNITAKHFSSVYNRNNASSKYRFNQLIYDHWGPFVNKMNYQELFKDRPSNNKRAIFMI